MSIDAKRDEFRRYLEQSGVMEALTRALVQLMEEPEKPPDAVAYLRDVLPGELGPAMEDKGDEVSLQKRIDQANKRIRDLEIAIEKMKASLAINPPEVTAAEDTTPVEENEKSENNDKTENTEKAENIEKEEVTS